VSKQTSWRKSLTDDLKKFRFRAPTEPYKGFASILKGYRTSDKNFAKSKFGNLSRKNLEEYAKAIGVSMKAYELSTADSSAPFGDNAGALNDLINEMIQADCQKGIDDAENARNKLEKDIASRLTSLERPVTTAKKAYDSAVLNCDKTREAMEKAELAF